MGTKDVAKHGVFGLEWPMRHWTEQTGLLMGHRLKTRDGVKPTQEMNNF
jgi:hypothetical protein